VSIDWQSVTNANERLGPWSPGYSKAYSWRGNDNGRHRQEIYKTTLEPQYGGPKHTSTMSRTTYGDDGACLI
jgi:hypothetical protein